MVGLPHPYWIEAVVVPRKDRAPSAAEIISHCEAHLAKFKVPKQVVFAEALPKNPSGKVLKRDLRNQYADLLQSSLDAADRY